MRPTAPDHRSPRRRGRVAHILLAALIVLAGLIPFAATASAAEGFTMDARAMFQGHTRNGTWMALKVSLTNDGPANGRFSMSCFGGKFGSNGTYQSKTGSPNDHIIARGHTGQGQPVSMVIGLPAQLAGGLYGGI